MTVTAVYADGRAVLMALLNPLFPAAEFCTSLPIGFESTLPICRIQRISGGDAGRSIDNPSIDLDCFAVDEISVDAFCAQLRTALTRQGVGFTAFNATIAAVGISSYGWRPYANLNVRSAGLTVNLTLHNH